jgi:TolB-like protein/DNA-binding SARP family transcriptional activator
MFELRTLGAIDLKRTRGASVGSLLAQPKRLAVVMYLATASPRGFHRRDTLLPLFWPELDEPHARNALNQTLHHIRRSLGSSALQSRGADEIGLDEDAVRCDAVAFDEAMRSDQFEKAVELYQGDFLTGFHIDDAAGFELWLQNERDQRKRQAVRAAIALASAEESKGNFTSAVIWLRRALTVAPTEELALRALIRLLCEMGDRAEAAHTYDAFAWRLATEYDLEPSPDTRALVNDLLRREAPDASSDNTVGAALTRGVPVEEPTSIGPLNEPAGARPRERNRPGSASRRRAPRLAALAALMVVLPLGIWFTLSALSSTDATSSDRDIPLLVLPFQNLGPSEHEYFADGITEETMAVLATVPGFRVISRTTAYRYKDAEKTLPEIANELGVDYVLEGTVRWQPDAHGPGRVRVTPKLVRVRDDAQVWAEDFDADFANIFAVQDSIARGVSQKLLARLASGAPRAELTGTRDPEAHLLVLKARHMLWNRTGGFPEVREPLVRQLFEQAIARDPGYAAAWAGLAQTEVVRARFAGGNNRDRRAYLERAESAARKAVTLAPRADGHVALALVLGEKGDWHGAASQFLRAIERDPSMAEARQLYAELLVALDRLDEARHQWAEARRLDPLSPVINVQNVRALLFIDRDYPAALREARALLKWQPDPWLLPVIAFAFQRLEQTDSAIHWFQAWNEETGRVPNEGLYDVQGNREGLRQMLDSAKARHLKENRPEAIEIARLHARLEELDSTFVWLQKVSWNVPRVNHLLYEFPFDPIRADPRYPELLKRIGVR